nr:MAG TPA: hypothetical protein [Caudoviricetes sp.]
MDGLSLRIMDFLVLLKKDALFASMRRRLRNG